MKLYVLLAFFCGLYNVGFSQNFSGQWKGEFLDKSTSYGSWGGDKCDYVIDLDCTGNKVTGYSYTYFTDEGKRFYTICRLTGVMDLKKNYIEVTEVERTKTNVPARIRNCFQLHKLTYAKTDSSETLSGAWVPAPNQDGNCGFGLTNLYKRTLKNSYPEFNKTASKATASRLPVTKAPVIVKQGTRIAPRAKSTVLLPKAKEKPLALKGNKQNIQAEETTIDVPVQKITNAPSSFEKRNTNLLKTLEIENESVRIDLYDNGEVDGDSISVYYNNKLLLGKKRLSEKAITLTLAVAADNQVNELVMYAENLGTIPPNTALMVVTDGSKRYEVRITSDLQKSGTIRFVHKKAGDL